MTVWHTALNTAKGQKTPCMHGVCLVLCLMTLLANPFLAALVATAAPGAGSVQLESPQDLLGIPKTEAEQQPKAAATPAATQTEFTPNANPENHNNNVPASAQGDVAGAAVAGAAEQPLHAEEPTPQPLPQQPQQLGAVAQASEPPGAAPKQKPLHLFGYVEFRGPLKNIPKWERVLKEEARDPTFGQELTRTMPENVRTQWLALREKLKDLPVMEQLKGINNFFNQWPYKTDIVAWGLEDYWATPKEFFKKSGDCEDFAIAKYYALRDLGIPASQMRIVAVMEKIRNIGHAVLVVFVDDKAYVLDNLSNLLLQHTRLPNYEPKFSVNEDFRWVHVKPLQKPGKK